MATIKWYLHAHEDDASWLVGDRLGIDDESEAARKIAGNICGALYEVVFHLSIDDETHEVTCTKISSVGNREFIPVE